MTVRNPEDIATFGLASSAFARHYLRNLGWCLFLALLRCFSSGGSPPIPIWFSIGYLTVGFPIRKSPDRSSFAAPRSLSQLITSFIGSWCQGIPLALFLAWSSSKFTPQIPHCLLCFRISSNASLLRYFSSQIKIRLRWVFDLALKQGAKLRFVIRNRFSLIRKVQ